MFLIRTAFWLSLVILLLPAGHRTSDAGHVAAPEPDLSALEALAAARDAIADLSAFCERNPETCATGSAALRLFGQKAQNGAHMLVEYLGEPSEARFAVMDEDGDQQPADTLRADDLEVPWQGPESQG